MAGQRTDQGAQPKLGSKSTALEALRGANLEGKTAVVTGGNSGIGVETIRALATAGADVVLCSRSLAAGEAVAEELRQSGVKGKIIVRQLDLADFQSIQAFAEGVQKELPDGRLDLLLLNAGVMALPSRQLTKDGFEMQLGTNHIGHQYLTTLLLPQLKKSPAARVVSVSSMGHKMGGLDLDDLNFERRRYNSWVAYGQSKLANILFAKELARRLGEEGAPVKAFALHPGVINTGLSRHMTGGGAFRLLASWMTWVPGVKTIQQGAATSVYAATAPELGTHSGAYLHNCAVAAPSKQGQDGELAKWLWAKTDELIAAALKRPGAEQ